MMMTLAASKISGQLGWRADFTSMLSQPADRCPSAACKPPDGVEAASKTSSLGQTRP